MRHPRQRKTSSSSKTASKQSVADDPGKVTETGVALVDVGVSAAQEGRVGGGARRGGRVVQIVQLSNGCSFENPNVTVVVTCTVKPTH